MTPSAYECAVLLLDAIPGLMRAVDSALRQRYGHDTATPSMGQMRMLAKLAERPWSLSELATAHRVTPSSMSRMVDVLVQRNWVERTTAPDDRRKVVLRLTPAGYAAHAAMRDVAREAAARLIEHLDERQRAHLYEGLSALYALIHIPSDTGRETTTGEAE
ncbi:MAG: MarR family transcriptional regulator [Roseiflexus sp.]|nr:MarR family transcriptional regulator [Roseiflexus sp.]MCS7289589.1 MarR family transcriptional regulator [Roseiflexus sp.]MDW8148621.1 MarR family transcriptional regulator [Roseiflexaceae bacterium]MDW8231730.1 MarR family transcriptional regulator [Roseiflexaceae bacterium]